MVWASPQTKRLTTASRNEVTDTAASEREGGEAAAAALERAAPAAAAAAVTCGAVKESGRGVRYKGAIALKKKAPFKKNGGGGTPSSHTSAQKKNPRTPVPRTPPKKGTADALFFLECVKSPPPLLENEKDPKSEPLSLSFYNKSAFLGIFFFM